MTRLGLICAALLAAAAVSPVRAAAPPSGVDALGAASSTFAKIDDYRATIVVHEIDGTRVEDRTYDVLFKKPMMERVDVVAGPGRGSGVVWLGGDKVKGHRGGLFSAIKLTLDLRDSQVTTLRGDSVDTATIPAMLEVFSKVKGAISEAPGPVIDGGPTVAVTLDVADPPAYDGVTREILYLSASTHLPVRRERFTGSTLVKSENVTAMQTDVGLTARDFPW